MGGACNTRADMRNAFSTLVGKSEGKRPLGRPRRCLESRSDVKVDLKETRFKDVN
jgi:hypothetical protein